LETIDEKKLQLAEKIAAYKKLIQQIEVLEEAKKQIAKEIIAEMPDKRFETPEYKVTRYQRLSILTTLEQARFFNATKMEEQIDKEKIKQLFHSGTPIEGVEEHSYLMVSIKKQVTNENPMRDFSSNQV
jgi:hypothetical protein